jgi:ATP phosphoribosyltransferase regulatory subunit
VVWSLWVDGLGSPIARGGRYDGVGSVFGRGRAATGFSLDAKIISAFVLDQTECSKIPAILVAAKEIDHPDNSDLLEVVHKLRSQGEVVISLDQGNEYSSSQFELNRHLVKKDGTWVVQSFGK